MKWVRKRKFNRTKHARIDDIESVERKVQQLLQLDDEAIEVSYKVYDHDPTHERNTSEMVSEEYSGSEDDAEGEEDEDEDYFAAQNGHSGQYLEPSYVESPANDIGQDELDDFEKAMLGAGEDDDEDEGEVSSAMNGSNAFLNADAASSFAVTSTSASPSATAAQTPASMPDASHSPDDDDGDEEEDEEDEEEDEEEQESDEDVDDAEKEGDENLQQVKDRIEDLKQKIAEQTELMRQTANQILKKKIMQKIAVLKADVEQMRNTAGLRDDDDDE